ncbi:MAG: hypothetical protein H0T59_06620 [Chloroflexi bacterium]|nr:hypothetical protein [Chloroflexota bacterium]
MTDFWPSIEDQLADLNRQATTVLDCSVPAPSGLPPTGSWIRAMKVDDDARGRPAGPWHSVAGWDGMMGSLSTRCRRRPGRAIAYALDRILGSPSPWPRLPSWERFGLLVGAERPSEDACQQCDVGPARDAARDRQATEAASLEAFDDAARALAENTRSTTPSAVVGSVSPPRSVERMTAPIVQERTSVLALADLRDELDRESVPEIVQ